MSVPKLRFKEFDGDWTKYKIAEVTEYLVDGTHFSPKSTDGEFKYITSKNIRNDGLDLTNISYISKDEHESIYKRCKVQLGDILLTKDGANTGNCCLNTLDEEFSLLSSVAVLRGKNQSFDNNFILQILQSDLGQNTIVSSMSGQAITRITLTKLKDYSFHFPEFKEQTKIASFLSAVDEKIAQLSQKHQLLSQYKQGMVQKLLNQKIRFKADDGSEFDHWKKTKLDDLLIKHEEKADRNYQYPVLTSSRNGMFFQKDYFAGQDVASSDTTGYNVVPFGYFTYRHMSDDLVFKFNINTLCEKGIVSTLYPVFTVKETHLNKYFLQIILNEGNEFRNFAIMQKQGGSRTYMYYSKLKELILNIPTLPEQTKIANFLSALDQKINVVSDQLEQAKLWKKGLLQQMFV